MALAASDCSKPMVMIRSHHYYKAEYTSATNRIPERIHTRSHTTIAFTLAGDAEVGGYINFSKAQSFPAGSVSTGNLTTVEVT